MDPLLVLEKLKALLEVQNRVQCYRRRRAVARELSGVGCCSSEAALVAAVVAASLSPAVDVSV